MPRSFIYLPYRHGPRSVDPVDRIVLDLRNNGGGLLQGAVETANAFLPPGDYP